MFDPLNPIGDIRQPGQFVDIPTKKRGGMFGGGVQIDLSGFLPGLLAGMGVPGGAEAQQAFQEARLMRQRMAMAQQEREQNKQDSRDNFVFEQDYKGAHPGVPDIQERINVLNGIKPGLGDTYANNYAANGGGMGPILTNPVTGQQMVSAAKVPAQAPPPEAVQELRANPSSAAQFDEIFGPGAAQRAIGGQAPQAPGGFPGYYP